MNKLLQKNTYHKKSKFDFTHDVNTTHGFGEVQCLQKQFVPAGTTSKIKLEQLIRCLPLTAPTFGRINYKTYTQFVPLADCFKPYVELKSQTFHDFQFKQKSGANSAYVDNQVGPEEPTMPWINSQWLMIQLLKDAKLCLFHRRYVNGQPNVDGPFQNWDMHERYYRLWLPYRATTAGATSDFPHCIQQYTNAGGANDAQPVADWREMIIAMTLPQMVISPHSYSSSSYETLFEPQIVPTIVQDDAGNDIANPDIWSPETGDFNIVGVGSMQRLLVLPDEEMTWDTKTSCEILLSYRLSPRGKRLYKILVGLGYSPNLNSNYALNALPLIAYARAYFNTFCKSRYYNFEDTTLHNLIELTGSTNNLYCDMDWWNTSINSAHTRRNFPELIETLLDEISESWYIDDDDFVSAHYGLNDTSSRYMNHMQPEGFTDISPSGDMYPSTYIQSSGAEGVKLDPQYITPNTLEMLKYFYRNVNIHTATGDRLKELMNVYGLKEYADTCKTNFIGYTSTPVKISTITQQSTTEQKEIGDFAGYGNGYDGGKEFVFTNDVDGFIITLAVIAPECRYSECIDPVNLATNAGLLYRPEFDSVGYETTPRICINNSYGFERFTKASSDAPRESYCEVDTNLNGFGLVPKESMFKYTRNILNGEMSLGSTRQSYDSYHLDKMIRTNVWSTKPNHRPEETYVIDMATLFDAGNMFATTNTLFPNASREWAIIGKNPSLGNFYRIFNQKVVDRLDETEGLDYPDVFTVQTVVHYDAYAPMLPMSQTWETMDEDDHVGDVTSI